MVSNFIVMLHKLIFTLGQKKRNPSITKWYHFLKKSEHWSLETLETYQLKKLKELLKFATTNSKFYKELYKEVDIDLIKSLSDLKKIPILKKEDLLKHSKEIHTNYSFKKKRIASTSGSSGESLVFMREEEAESFNRAAIFRGYSWYGVKPWNQNGYFWGFNFSLRERIKIKILDFLQNRFRVFSYESNSLESFVKKLKKVIYIHGYSSMIFQIAKLINEKKMPKPLGIKMVKGTSEKIFESYQEEVNKAFGMKIISEYGATESGIIAFECPSGNMHINMEGVLVEEIENEIVVTNLQMKSFPIIRYKLGDYITLAPKNESCTCGKNHSILKEVTGRVGANIYGHQQIYPSLYFYYIFKNIAKTNHLKLNYQVVQNQKGKLIFRIEQDLNTEDRTLLEKEIKKYFKMDMDFEIIGNTSLIATQGKFKSFISNIQNDER